MRVKFFRGLSLQKLENTVNDFLENTKNVSKIEVSSILENDHGYYLILTYKLNL